ncbi:peptidoglycan-binding protein [Phormidesmis priestleyi ULC007]|uniref:Peptidoglycan-binding protein n=1 Tax=Phormidesmis priestleyi ULC007 TaxID=1920490 RepID=A0A2T1D949_9CYAN|nr:peptidoglycan-binding domain-containing protein [Phormidesmis priestleyi]PSB16976.1 peptidoglycan-binding protein [Phormidesmis priestleyi ULC007]PZO47915.1 MAG: peptidoglycan-binding protein [Phormidesmis priestleyi]
MSNSVRRYTAPPSSCPIAFLRQGSTGTDVIDLQYSLQQRGFNPGAIDGSFGSRTHTAVYRFQFSQELSLTGSVDLETWQALDHVC